MGVEQANPKIARQVIQVAKQCTKRGRISRQSPGRGGEFFWGCDRTGASRSQIQAVISRVLRNQVQFLDPVGEELPGLLYDVILRSAAMRAAHAWNCTKAARMVAPF